MSELKPKLSLANLIDETVKERRPTPKCCRECQHLDWEYDDWAQHHYRICALYVWMPFVKQTCKRQKPPSC